MADVKDTDAKPKSGELKSTLLHNGNEIHAGEKAPDDLTKEQTDRLKDLGVL